MPFFLHLPIKINTYGQILNIVFRKRRVKYMWNVIFFYSSFRQTLPKSSLQMHGVSVSFLVIYRFNLLPDLLSFPYLHLHFPSIQLWYFLQIHYINYFTWPMTSFFHSSRDGMFLKSADVIANRDESTNYCKVLFTASMLGKKLWLLFEECQAEGRDIICQRTELSYFLYLETSSIPSHPLCFLELVG